MRITRASSRKTLLGAAAVLLVGGGSAAWYVQSHTADDYPPGELLMQRAADAQPASSSECRPSRASFEGRDYLACVPKDDGGRVAVFLHGMLKGDPLEAAPQILDRLVAWGEETGTSIVIPTARGKCDYLDPPKLDFLCWPNQEVKPDAGYLSRLLAHVEQQHGRRFPEKFVAGYSNGGYFLARALQRGLLDGFDRVGLLAGGSPDRARPADEESPEVFVEIANEDEWNAPWGRKLVPKLREEGYLLHTREVAGGHQYDASRFADFLTWFGGS